MLLLLQLLLLQHLLRCHNLLSRHHHLPWHHHILGWDHLRGAHHLWLWVDREGQTVWGQATQIPLPCAVRRGWCRALLFTLVILLDNNYLALCRWRNLTNCISGRPFPSTSESFHASGNLFYIGNFCCITSC